MPCMHRQTKVLAVLQAWPCLHDSWDKGVLHCAGGPPQMGAGTYCVGGGELDIFSVLKSLQCTVLPPTLSFFA